MTDPTLTVTVTVVRVDQVPDLPGRGGDSDLLAISESLGGPIEVEEARAFLGEGLTADEPDVFTSRFLGELLLRPPIPAGCVALMARLAEGEQPWMDHEVAEDRAGLFTAHALAHLVAPERFAAPSLPRAVLTLTPPPPPNTWRRPRPRTLLVARALSAMPEASATWGEPVEDWAFDTLWHVGATPDDTAVTVDVRGPLAWPATMQAGLSWKFEQS